VSYRVDVWESAQHDIAALPHVIRLAALGIALALRENPWLGEPLRNRIRNGDLSRCRAVRFDRAGWKEKPRYRLVYFNDPNDGSIAVVQVIAIGPRSQLEAYKAAAARLRKQRREELGK
jgi:hypothetical protein